MICHPSPRSLLTSSSALCDPGRVYPVLMIFTSLYWLRLFFSFFIGPPADRTTVVKQEQEIYQMTNICNSLYFKVNVRNRPILKIFRNCLFFEQLPIFMCSCLRFRVYITDCGVRDIKLMRHARRCLRLCGLPSSKRFRTSKRRVTSVCRYDS